MPNLLSPNGTVSPITVYRDYMKGLRTRLAGAGLAVTDLQLYSHFVNSLLAEYDMIVAVHDPAPLYSVDTLCERFRAIECRERKEWPSGESDPYHCVSSSKALPLGHWTDMGEGSLPQHETPKGVAHLEGRKLN